MNNDLISREALKKSMRKSINERYISWTKTITVADIATLIFDEIDNASTVDTYTEDDVQYDGTWSYDYTNGFGNKIGHCSKCKYPCERYNYCPICGADMRGGTE